jgi:tRNA threonylcarbamoyladenosine biosynthesis protein TsaE
VSSPTFVLVQEYAGRLRLLHADLYRIAGPEEAAELGLAQDLDERTVLAVEWAERAGTELGGDRLEIHLRHRGPKSRDLHFRGTGPLALACLTRLRRAGPLRRRMGSAAGRRVRP